MTDGQLQRGLTRLLAATSLLLTLAVVGCRAGVRETAEAVTAEDSAGVRIVTTHRPEWTGVGEWSEGLELKAPSTDQAPSLARLVAARILPDGRLAVLDRQERRIFLFAADGALLDSIGGPGQGPGEFTTPMTLEVSSEGSMQVFDLSTGRITEFLPDGSVDRIVTLKGPGFSDEWRIAQAWLVDSDRVFVWEHVEGERVSASQSADAERLVVPGQLRLVDLSTGAFETLYEASARDWIVEESRAWVAPFGPGATMAFEGGRVYISPGLAHEVSIVDPEAGVVATYRYPAVDRAFDIAKLRQLEDEAREEARLGGYQFIAGPIFSPEVQPPMHPAIRQVRVRETGEVWLQVHEPSHLDSQDWWVIGTDGGFRGVLRLADRRAVLAFDGSRALMVSLDEYDVPSLEIWRIPEVLP